MAAVVTGQRVVVRGPRGIGKSALLDRAVALTTRHVRRISCTPGELDVARGLVGEVPSATNTYATFRELTRRLGDDDLLVLDDAHDCDPVSLRWLDFVLRRRDIAVLLAQRDDAPGLTDLTVSHGFDIVEPAPLNLEQTGQLFDDADPELAYLLTGGNPGRLTELRSATDGPITRTVVREVIGRRLRRLPATTRHVAAVLAVLGRADAELAGPLAGVSAHELATRVASLTAECLLGQGLPPPYGEWVRQSALDVMNPAEVTALRERAAMIVDENGRPAVDVARQLAHLESVDVSWTPVLKAATAKPGKLSPDVANRCLTLLVQRRPDDAEARLRLAESADARTAAGHLMAAFHGAADPELRAEAAVRYALTTRSAQARGLLADCTGLPDEQQLLVDTLTLWLDLIHPATTKTAVERAKTLRPPPGHDRGERCLLGVLAEANAIGGGTLETSLDLARRAVGGELVINDWSMLCATRVLRLAGHAAEAFEVLDTAVERITERAALSRVLADRAVAAMAAGDPRAVADARRAYDLVPGDSRATVVLARTLARLDEVAPARALLDGAEVSEVDQVDHLYALALVEFAAGDVTKAADVLHTAAGLLDRRGVPDPAWIMLWAEYASFSNMARRKEVADAAARRVVELANQWRSVETAGYSAITRAATMRRMDTQLAAEGAERFAAAGAFAAQAWAELVLGVFLRRTGDNQRARVHLRSSVRLATRCGYRLLADRARFHLVAAGGRIRVSDHGSPVLSGLTYSERRVVELAVSGASNADIAQHLFVTLRTVEKHLTKAYRKLGVVGRTELPELVTGLVSGT
ncbi:LuxR family transcriptional regulator [Lentzea sp. NBRC 105346]|nr:LuxR family transcriptional regulator [Lentzea sp. NBRC 105346]